MAIVTSSYNNGKFKLNGGSIKERLPLLTSGLVAYFPFDGESAGLQSDNTTKINPSADSNTSKSFREGLGIGSVTTNLVSSISATWGPWSGIVGTSVDYNNFYMRNGVHVKITTSGGANVHYAPAFNVSPSTVYTISAMVKIISGTPSANLFYVREYRANDTQSIEHGEFNMFYTYYVQDNWYKAYATFTTQADAHHIAFMGYEYTAGVEYMIEDVQIEQRSFFTSYVSGTRAAASGLTLPISGNLTTYSIVGKFIPHTPLDGTYNQTADQAVLFMISDAADAGHIYYRYYISSPNSFPFLDLDGTFGASHIHQFYTLAAYKESYYAIRKTGTNFECKIYQNGVWQTTHTATLSNNTQLAYIQLGSDTIWNMDHKELNVYNRVLTDAELDLIVTGKQIIRSNGDLGCFLNEDTNPNLWGNPDLNTTTYQVRGNVTPVLKTDSYGTYHEMVISSIGSTYKGYDISTNNGSTYVFSGWFWLSTGHTFDYVVLAIEGATSISGNIYCSSLLTNQWVYAEETCVADDNVRFLIYPTATNGSGTIKWRNMSVKKLSSNNVKLNGHAELEVTDFSE